MRERGRRSIAARMSPAPQVPARPPAWIAWLLAAVLLGLGLRLWLAQGDLWLDEIWSWRFARELRSPLDVWRLAHDNNHPLNTLWLWILGPDAGALACRALALASGTLAVVCAGLLGRRRGAFEGCACALLAATSTLLAYYSAEARGYAPAVAAFLGGWLALERFEQRGGKLALVGWWSCALLGLAAHFTFVFGLGALGAATLVRAPRRFALAHLVPIAATLWIGLGFVRGMQYGGGDAWSWREIGAQAGGWTSGLPENALGLAAGALLALGALALEQRSALVPALLLIVPPLVTALVLKPHFVALRYFSVPLAGLTVLLGLALGRLPRLAALALLGALAGLNLARDAALARAGRGQYRAALEYMASESEGASLALASDLPFDTRLTVEFHARGLAKPVAWFPAPPPQGVDWLIVTRAERPPLVQASGVRYTLRRVFEAAGPSSYCWALYRRAQ